MFFTLYFFLKLSCYFPLERPPSPLGSHTFFFSSSWLGDTPRYMRLPCSYVTPRHIHTAWESVCVRERESWGREWEESESVGRERENREGMPKGKQLVVWRVVSCTVIQWYMLQKTTLGERGHITQSVSECWLMMIHLVIDIDICDWWLVISCVLFTWDYFPFFVIGSGDWF